MAERPVYTKNPFKKETSFGVVWALLTPVSDFHEEVRRVMCLPDEGEVIEIHMPEAVRGNGKNGNKYAGVLGVIREGFGYVASGIDRWGVDAHSVVAITNEIAGLTSRRYGFAVEEVSQEHVDEKRIERAWKGFKLTSRYASDADKKEKMRIFACYQTFENFMQKFGKHADSVHEEVSS